MSVTEASEEAVEVILAFEVEILVPPLVKVKLLHLVCRNHPSEAKVEAWGLKRRLVVAGRQLVLFKNP